MKNKILDLAKSAGWFVLIFIIGVIGFRIPFSLGTPHEKEEFNIKIFTKKGHDYLIVDTKHGVCVVHAESCPCSYGQNKITCTITLPDAKTGRGKE